jgi:two-component system, chemotaxis family, CheB/CheR fusion protein
MNQKKTPVPIQQLTHAIGHEVKQPLGLIRAYSYYLKKSLETTNPELSAYTDKIDQQVDTITGMLNDIVESTRLSENFITFKQNPLDLISCCEKVIEELKRSNSGILVTLTHSDSAIRVLGDELYLKQVINQVIENAIKYSIKQTEIKVTVEKIDTNAVMTISNKGLGIPETEIDHIFENYYRATNSKEASIKGLGLGLYIAKKIVEAHQGTITASTDNSNLTTLVVTIPLLQT